MAIPRTSGAGRVWQRHADGLAAADRTRTRNLHVRRRLGLRPAHHGDPIQPRAEFDRRSGRACDAHRRLGSAECRGHRVRARARAARRNSKRRCRERRGACRSAGRGHRVCGGIRPRRQGHLPRCEGRMATARDRHSDRRAFPPALRLHRRHRVQSSTVRHQITANKPIKVRYRDVGIEIDSSKSGFDAFGVIYENASFDIEDPGQWTIDGPLGELIRVAATRAGSGSTWVELDLTFALDLGVVKITGCTLRATFSNSGLGIEFRGFSASIDLPGVVSGSGAVSIGDGGLIRAGLAATIVPINTSAVASLALQGDFVALEVGVLLPVGIPLAQSGLAIYGFVGRVVSNGRRDMSDTNADPVQRELDWYASPARTNTARLPANGRWGSASVSARCPTRVSPSTRSACCLSASLIPMSSSASTRSYSSNRSCRRPTAIRLPPG